MATDVQNDLHSPLMPREKLGEKWSGRWAKLGVALSWFNRVGGALLSLVLVFLVGWIIFTEDPFGGEPQAVSPILIAAVPSEQNDGVAPSQPLPSAQPAPIAGEPRVLRVPQSGPVDVLANGQALPSMIPGTAEAFSPRFDDRGGLIPTTNPSLVERFDSSSFVPTLGPNNERALDAYARPLEAGTVPDNQPRIVLIVSGLGLSQTSTQEVLNRLPPTTTLSFAPYGSSLDRWSDRARRLGFEYLVEVPMEPFDYPNNDPGPHTLRVNLAVEANLERMHWALSRVPTPIGFMNYMGGRFASETASLQPIVADALGRGLMVVDDGRSARSLIVDVAGDESPALRADVVIDARANGESINNRLAQLESLARDRGRAVGVATALPLTINALEEWTASLASKGIALVPASSLVRF